MPSWPARRRTSAASSFISRKVGGPTRRRLLWWWWWWWPWWWWWWWGCVAVDSESVEICRAAKLGAGKVATPTTGAAACEADAAAAAAAPAAAAAAAACACACAARLRGGSPPAAPLAPAASASDKRLSVRVSNARLEPAAALLRSACSTGRRPLLTVEASERVRPAPPPSPALPAGITSTL